MTKIETITEKVDILDVLSHFNIYPNAQNDIHCLCHTDTHPSMKVYTDNPERNGKKQIVQCFVCGASLDVVDIVSKIKGLDYFQSIIYLDNLFKLGFNKKLDAETAKKIRCQEYVREYRKLQKIKNEKCEKETFITLANLIRDATERYYKISRPKGKWYDWLENGIGLEYYQLGEKLEFWNWIYDKLLEKSREPCKYDYIYGNLTKEKMLDNIKRKRIKI